MKLLILKQKNTIKGKFWTTETLLLEQNLNILKVILVQKRYFKFENPAHVLKTLNTWQTFTR